MMDIHAHPPMAAAARKPGEFNNTKVHFIGIGGCGMYGAANILVKNGAKVSGSDQKTFDRAGNLVQAGARIHIGHDAQNLTKDTQLVVRSAAVPDDNPEVVAARQANIPVITYAELLGEITIAKQGVSLAGTHGKSTTTGLTTHLFKSAGLDPSFIVGADCPQLGGSSGVGSGDHFIVESCEYARSFLHMRPHSAAILNVEADHLDCYRDLDEIVGAFKAFAGRVSPNGLLVVNADDRFALRAARGASCRVETYGLSPKADWRAVGLRPSKGRFLFRIYRHDQFLTCCSPALPGRYNVGNALAAAALAYEAGASPSQIARAAATFRGVDRRMTLRGKGHGVTVVDDYAHHPTEIRVTLRALRDHYEPRRTWVVFQPHQASRTRIMMDDFGQAFSDADFVLVPDIFCVRDTEEDMRNIASSGLVDRIRLSGTNSQYLPSFDDVTRHLEQNIADGDLVITMGAGDVWKVADGIAAMVR